MNPRAAFALYFGLCASLCFADDLATKGKAVCFDVENKGRLISGQTVRCFPGAGKAPGTISFIVIFENARFDDFERKRAHLIFGMLLVGKALNDEPSVKGDEVWVTDVTLAKDRSGFAFPTSLPKTLQRRMASNELGVKETYDLLSKSIYKITMPAGK